MILIDMEVFDNIKKLYEIFEAIVDTGATFCVLAGHIAQIMGYKPEDKVHLWQINGPLVPPTSTLKLRYKKKEYSVESVIIDINKNYLQSAKDDEKCTRPVTPHPLASRIILGKSFLEKLTESERKEILTFLI